MNTDQLREKKAQLITLLTDARTKHARAVDEEAMWSDKIEDYEEELEDIDRQIADRHRPKASHVGMDEDAIRSHLRTTKQLVEDYFDNTQCYSDQAESISPAVQDFIRWAHDRL